MAISPVIGHRATVGARRRGARVPAHFVLGSAWGRGSRCPAEEQRAPDETRATKGAAIREVESEQRRTEDGRRVRASV